MKLRNLIVTLASFVGVVFAVSGASRPNIVLLYPDDMRWDSFGAVQRENGAQARFPWLETPNLDRLWNESARFRQSFVVTSLCSPGRAAVMTSQHGHRNGVYNNGTPLPATARTFAEHLQKAGYRTAYFGKWHMDGQTDRPHYDESASFVGQGKYFDCPLLVNGVETPTKGWVDDVTTDYAVRFIEKQRERDQPFFLWLGFKSPHGPRGGDNLPEPLRQLFDGASSQGTPNTGLTAIYQQERERARRGGDGPNQGHQDFHRHIAGVDACVGRVLAALEGSGKLADTIVLLSSDNGYYLGEHGLGDKRTAYDESLRVPLLVRLPDGRSAGKDLASMVLNIDYGPTILDYAGAEPLPEAQGRSLRPLLDGKIPTNWRTAFFYEYFQEGRFPQPTILAVRTTTQKLITYPGHPEWTEVFDLARDPFETQNLAEDDDLRGRLQTRLDAEAAAVDFRWPAGFGPQGKSSP